MALKNFNPDTFLDNWSEEEYSPLQNGKPFVQCIGEAFGVPPTDTYVYRAQAETTLNLTQRAIGAKRQHGMHGWYHDDEGKPLSSPHPSKEDMTEYTTLFAPNTSLPKRLNAFASSAKPTTLGATISTHLKSQYHNNTSGLVPTRKPKSPPREHKNPYYDLWAYSCHELEWAGPTPQTTHTKISHHILPIFYHHFGCVVPSYAALHVLAKLCQPAKPSVDPSVLPILDIGSGNGYWTYMLRNFPVTQIDAAAKTLDVRAVDDATSEYRVTWIGDTIRMDGRDYLKKKNGGKGCVLLLVYPQAMGNFTESVLRAFEGEWIVVAGTQNGNGFTGFQGEVVDRWVERELKGVKLVLRMPLPSFAGKDEALFLFQRSK